LLEEYTLSILLKTKARHWIFRLLKAKTMHWIIGENHEIGINQEIDC